MQRQQPFLLFVLLLGLTSCVGINTKLVELEQLPLEKLRLPAGFSIELFAHEGLSGPRSLCRGDSGTIFAGTRGSKVYALADTNGDYRADQVYVLAENLNTPNGVAFKDGALYVAEIDKVWRYDHIESRLANPPQPVLVSDAFPSNKWHGWKYIAFGPDGLLYVPVGAPCNICDRDADGYANIMRMHPDGSGLEVFARGVRNTVGFDWQPGTGELWFTDNGRDLMGDDLPNDELNHAPQAGMHFGYPFCHAGDIPDPKFGEKRPCADFTPPVQKLAPHAAALGMKFYTGSMFPQAYRGHIFIAEHGSWNRSELIGYRLSLVKLNGNQALSYEPFIEGWLQDGAAWGRPVDLLQLPDGSLLLSDDHANAI
ncbi:MAG: sorbosone dehydrogenase family protein, partial [Bacteroidetes bacterium]